jgi:hypothetical protein
MYKNTEGHAYFQNIMNLIQIHSNWYITTPSKHGNNMFATISICY